MKKNRKINPKNLLVRIKEKLRLILQRKGAGSNFWARVYYSFFDKSFVRENRSVLQGKIMHTSPTADGKQNEYKIRRNIHRIEKGLIIPNRKSSFANRYILETVKAFEKEFKKPGHDPELIEWARDVLSLFFKEVNPEGQIAEAFELFKSLSSSEHMIRRVPHRRTTPSAVVDFEAFMGLCKQRVSTRIYKEKPVPDALLERAFKAALFSPSACNRQPFEFLVYQNPETIDRLVSLPPGITGFEKNIPALVFLIGDLSAYFDERDRHLIYIDGGLVSMSLMLALETLGLSSCVLNWPDVEERESMLENELKLPKHKRCILVMTIGYPDEDGKIPFSAKRDVSQTVKFVR